MSKKKNTFRNDQVALIGSSCLIVGFLLGLLSYHVIMGPGPSSAPAPQATITQPPATIAPPTAAMSNLNSQIRELESILQTDPSNRRAWVTLGNLLFDSDQYGKSIDAYSKALELDPNDANVLTDRAIMYRKLGDYETAAAELKKAAVVDPNHLNSLMNLGVVLFHDLQDFQGALEAWEGALKRNPSAEVAEQLKARIKTVRESYIEGSGGANQ